MNKLTVIVLLLLAVLFPLSGQKIVPTPADLYSEAVEFMFSGDYSDALPILLELAGQRGFNSPNISYKIGECYLNSPGSKNKGHSLLKRSFAKGLGKLYRRIA